MQNTHYKKMAGTSAVFVLEDCNRATPVEWDGLVWTGEELNLDSLSSQRTEKPPMASVLALEGLEDYDPPSDGDTRIVNSLNVPFIYLANGRAWIQVDKSIRTPESA